MEEDFFSESIFHEGGEIFWAILWGVVLHGEANDQIMPKGGGGASQMHFPVIVTLQICTFSPTMVEYSLEDKVIF